MSILQDLKNRLKSAFQGNADLRAVNAPEYSGDENMYIFMGVEEEPHTGGNEFQFWAGQYYDGQVFPWPASTTNEELFEVFRNMEKGQMFRIAIHGEPLGPDQGFGVYVEEIDRDINAYPKLSLQFVKENEFTLG